MNNSNLWLDIEQDLRENLLRLKEDYGCVSLKVSTEDAAMSFEEISEVYRLFNDILPIVCKIGGPEAKNDMHNIVNIGVSGLIAPMIESSYSLQKFIESLKEVLEPIKFNSISKHINLETIQGVENIEKIIHSESFNYISQITIGRTDLSRSMNNVPDSEEVFEQVFKIVSLLKLQQKEISIGGNITPKNASVLAEKLMPDKLNTREVGFSLAKTKDIFKTVSEILKFEQKLISYKMNYFQYQISLLEDRHQKLNIRLKK